MAGVRCPPGWHLFNLCYFLKVLLNSACVSADLVMIGRMLHVTAVQHWQTVPGVTLRETGYKIAVLILN